MGYAWPYEPYVFSEKRQSNKDTVHLIFSIKAWWVCMAISNDQVSINPGLLWYKHCFLIRVISDRHYSQKHFKSRKIECCSSISNYPPDIALSPWQLLIFKANQLIWDVHVLCFISLCNVTVNRLSGWGCPQGTSLYAAFDVLQRVSLLDAKVVMMMGFLEQTDPLYSYDSTVWSYLSYKHLWCHNKTHGISRSLKGNRALAKKQQRPGTLQDISSTNHVVSKGCSGTALNGAVNIEKLHQQTCIAKGGDSKLSWFQSLFQFMPSPDLVSWTWINK